MALSNGPNLGLLIAGAAGEAHYDELLRQWRGLDLLVQPVVISAAVTVEPSTPADGDSYIVPTGATGTDWAGNDGKLARYADGHGWEFFEANEGWKVFDKATGTTKKFDGSAWRSDGRNAPACQVSNSASMAITPATPTKINFDTETFDTDNCFDTTLNRFTPNVAGYYKVEAIIGFIGAASPAGERGEIYIYKNGVLSTQDYKELLLAGSSNETPIGGVVYCDGIDDYIEIWGQTVVVGTNVYFSLPYTNLNIYRLDI